MPKNPPIEEEDDDDFDFSFVDDDPPGSTHVKFNDSGITSDRASDDDTEVPAPLRLPGRPPKAPKNLIRTPVRCLVTERLRIELEKGGKLHGLNLSSYFRLALYRQLERDGLLTLEVKKDATWDELRSAGAV